LLDDARFPWLVLIPRQEELTELHQLDHLQAQHVFSEISRASAALSSLPMITKLNVGALGNLVPQLHLHVVGRHAGDDAWPGPVWGSGTRQPYEDAALQQRLQYLQQQLAS